MTMGRCVVVSINVSNIVDDDRSPGRGDESRQDRVGTVKIGARLD